MSDQGKHAAESISALMDSEVSELEFHRVLRDISQDGELRQKWHRYHLISAALKHELPNYFIDQSDAIRAAIDSEPSHKKAFPLQTVLKPLSRFAIAASVAVVAVLGVQLSQQQNQAQPPLANVELGTNDAEAFTPRAISILNTLPLRTVNASNGIEQSSSHPVIVLRKIGSENQKDQQIIQDRLNELMLQHTDNAALNSYQGMMPFVRIPKDME